MRCSRVLICSNRYMVKAISLVLGFIRVNFTTLIFHVKGIPRFLVNLHRVLFFTHRCKCIQSNYSRINGKYQRIGSLLSGSAFFQIVQHSRMLIDC